ncbi:Smr/MutS family protein [Streptomyces sp. NPDC057052]|uniref:Smr/MutS family protein n=1 Tax=Streptomyces sp. NPDC057052 TaxID=3346010 RepID=UPI00363D7167
MVHTMPSLDLHPVLRNNRDIELALRRFLFTAHRSGGPVVEIIPDRETGRLRERVLTFLAQRHVRRLYERVEAGDGGTGRMLWCTSPGAEVTGPDAPAGRPRDLWPRVRPVTDPPSAVRAWARS